LLESETKRHRLDLGKAATDRGRRELASHVAHDAVEFMRKSGFSMRGLRRCRTPVVVVLLCAPLSLRARTPDTVWSTVEGHPMWLLIAGRGSPTIVLKAGSGGTSRTWRTLQRVVSCNRAGLGRSEP
jgi:hypothetical protein